MLLAQAQQAAQQATQAAGGALVIHPVSPQQATAGANAALGSLIGMLSSIMPWIVIALIILGAIVAGVGALFGSRGMRNAGSGAIGFALLGLILVKAAPYVVGLIQGFVGSGPK